MKVLSGPMSIWQGPFVLEEVARVGFFVAS